MADPEVIQTDVLVVGAGGAGMRAAIGAAEAGCTVDVVCKSLLGKAHTVMAEGGIAAGFGNVDKADSWEVHFADTMRGGKMVNNWRMVEIFAQEVLDRVLELERWGGLFDRTPEGRILQRAFGAHTYKRLCHVGDRTGLELIRTCQDRLVHTSARVHMEFTLTRLLRDGDRVVGAFGYDRNDGRSVAFQAKAVVLASGGWGRMYRITSNSWEGTGDGADMAYDAGAELMDMEFVQFHPTGMVWPPGARGILVTEAARGEGGLLRNKLGDRFMLDYDPQRKELSSRDVVARSIYKEVMAGRGTEHGGVFLDVTHLGPAAVRKKLPSMVEQFHALAGVDITREPMEVAPTIHYTMGGVKVDPETAATSVTGLYAAGEVAAGVHGANRLGGNSLGDILVFGKRAGDAAAQYVRQVSHGRLPQDQMALEEQALLRPLQDGEGENPYALHRELQDTMQAGAAIARTATSLQQALDGVSQLRERSRKIRVRCGRHFNPSWHAVGDLRAMLTVSEAIIRAGLERKESRGSQWRLDFPDLDAAQGRQNWLAFKGPDGSMRMRAEPIPPLPERLAKLMKETT